MNAPRVSTSTLAKVNVQAVDIDPDVLEAAFETASATKFPESHPVVIALRESIADAPERLDPKTGKPMSRIGRAKALMPVDGETPETVVKLVERVAASIGLGKPLTQVKSTANGTLVLFRARTKIVGAGRRKKPAETTPAKPARRPRA